MHDICCIFSCFLFCRRYDDDYDYDDDGDNIVSEYVEVDGRTKISVPLRERVFIGKSILFVGDSHMRGLADLFLQQVCDLRVTEPYIYRQIVNSTALQTVELYNDSYSMHWIEGKNLLSKRITKDEAPFDTDCLGLKAMYLPMTYCESGIMEHVEQNSLDYIVVNCGHHPASEAHFTYSLYR